MAFKLSLETNQGKISHSTRSSFLEVLYNVSQIVQKSFLLSNIIAFMLKDHKLHFAERFLTLFLC